MPSNSDVALEALEQRLMSAELSENPYPLYAELREIGPAVELPNLHGWLVVSYDGVYGALRNHEVFSSTSMGGDEQEAGRLVLISDDPPRHTRLRGLVNKAFTPRRVAALEPWISGIVEGLVEAFEDGETEVMDKIAVPVPTVVIAELLGVPSEDRERFKRWSDALIAATRSAEDEEQRQLQMMEMAQYFQQVITERRAAPADDLLSALTVAEIDGEQLEDWEILGMGALILVAGNETTTNLIGNLLNVLAERPELWAQLREDRSIVDPVIDETLRYDSPVQMLSRYTLADAEVGAVTIPQGSEVNVIFAAANRDPAGFPEPDEFRLDRDLNRHVAFGMGIHYCLGSPLARAETRIVLNTLLDRYTTLEFGATPSVHQSSSNIVRGFASLPLRFSA